MWSLASFAPRAMRGRDQDSGQTGPARQGPDRRTWKPSEVSLMPNGLAKGLSPQDFADLIAYLKTLKNTK